MTDVATLEKIRTVDSDSHVVEPPDLWLARLPKKFLDDAPRVVTHPGRNDVPHWHLPTPGVWLTPLGQYCRQNGAKSLDELDRGAWDAADRLDRMDEFGIYAQVLYPNLISFETVHFLDHGDPEFVLACIRAYNDWLIEFSSADPARYIPIAVLPFWDVDASLAEIKRCKAAGHKGLLWSNKMEELDQPGITDRHWDPIYALAEDVELSLNMHVAAVQRSTLADMINLVDLNATPTPEQMAAVGMTSPTLILMSNADAICRIVSSDVCERFPRLKFVSVESGFGYVPWLLSALDWFMNMGANGVRVSNGELTPKERFRRQCYGSFWFETDTLRMLDLYPDNFMFETDFPHPASLAAGPGFDFDVRGHVASAFRDVPPDLARKALHDNAAAVYNLDG